ncbi:hypothetical protein MRB53_007973 [Persea americana]|uniref:Uncharacterized protein n=1 Tax=Persea americana TaxID=3435 RepID=A0ACC2MKG2_PERAE|nr:hypothetical protein MRB53_007973 [Persea americana]
MRCQSVACLWWRGAPPLHRVTASAALNQPPTLYTGGSDGSIIWWNLSNNQKEIWPMAMLCGHTAAIADLEICMPVICHGEMENSKAVGIANAEENCLHGLEFHLGCQHCLCPRVETAEEGNSSHNQNDPVIDKETHYRRLLKCAVVIVDSCTLNIIQTVFHGSLSIGPLKFMTVVPSLEDMERQLVILADAFGKVQSIEIPESNPYGDGGSGLQRNSTYVWSTLGTDIAHDAVQEVSVTTHGNLVVLVFRTLCIFKSTTNGTIIGEISLVDSSLCNEGTFLMGGMFLPSGFSCNALDEQDQTEGFLENFLVWSNTGAAIMYAISLVGDSFYFEPQCELPPVSHTDDRKIAIDFCHLNNYLLRIESICFDEEASSLWKPHISIFQPPLIQLTQCSARRRNDSGNPYMCIILGEGGFLGDWVGGFCSLSEAEDPRRNKCLKATKIEKDENSMQGCVASSTNLNGLHREHGNSILPKWEFVSSSLVLSEDFYAPYAVVYGFCTGEIQIVRFEMFSQNSSIVDGNLPHDSSPSISEQSFSGHTGAVLCLAAHRMKTISNDQSFKSVLVSGGTDCTIRIWDLDTGSFVCVMHHHVGPVRQIILPPPWTDRPWADCFLSVGEDSCVALVSLESLRVERMFPGHPSYPAMVVWDSARGYLACLCHNSSASSNVVNILYLWDIKTGARERVLRGTASHSMFDHFCRGINVNAITGNILGGTTSASSLLLSVIDDSSFSQSHVTNSEKGVTVAPVAVNAQRRTKDFNESDGSEVHVNKGKQPILKASHVSSSHVDGTFVKQSPSHAVLQNKKHVIKCSCPFPGIATLKFDLSSLMHPIQRNEQFIWNGGMQESAYGLVQDSVKPNFQQTSSNDCSVVKGSASHPIEEQAWIKSLEGFLLRFSLSFLHLWGVDHELDKLLIDEMSVCRPESFVVASGLLGDKGSLTLAFPGSQATLELWRSSSEFCAMRSLTMVSLAQRMISLSRSSSAASSALAAFYTRHFAEKVPDIKPPLLQLLVSFWQDPSEHVRMAARSLFHCAASRTIPRSLCGPKIIQHAHHMSYMNGTGDTLHLNASDTSASSLLELNEITEAAGDYRDDESSIVSWLESFEMQDWISCIGGTSQDAMASNIIVAAALVVWYPSLVKLSLTKLVVHPLIKLVMAMSDKYSSTAAELLAEGMESTWKACISPEISRLIGDILFQVECVSGASANDATHNPSLAVTIRETLVGILLPSLAMADIVGFLNVIESQIWATASDSPVHLVSIMTLIRVVRGSPKPLVPHLDKVVNFILQTMDLGNSVMRKACLPSSMATLKEIVRVFPMIALNEASTRLAVGDAIGDIRSATIRVYDLQSVTKMKVLDASGPPGFPSLLGGASDTTITTSISALSFSPDGEGLVAFSENGLMIRWWSLGSGWWEKLSKSLVPVQCTKLIFLPPWEGFSPNSSRSSIMASMIERDNQVVSQEKTPRGSSDADSLNLLIHNLDLSYRLEWVRERKAVLMRHSHELGTFQL